MSTGIGIDAVDVAGTWVGRSALDDRLLVRAQYHNLGVVMGGKVAPSATAMAYTVGPGTDPVSVGVGSRSGADGASLFVIPHGTVATTAAPASGARIDVIWAKQNDPSKGDADNQSVLGITPGTANAAPTVPAIPAGAVTLAQYRVGANITTTSAATLVRVGDYAIPYGASLGALYTFQDLSNSAIPAGVTLRGSGTFTIPTRRRVKLEITATIMSTVAGGEGSLYLVPRLDGVDQATLLASFTGDANTFTFAQSMTLEPGTHTIALAYSPRSGVASRPVYGAYQGKNFGGVAFQVVDQGVG